MDAEGLGWPDWVDDSEEEVLYVEAVVGETPDAILCRWDGGGERWVPRSVIADDSEVKGPGDTGSLVVKSWWVYRNSPL